MNEWNSMQATKIVLAIIGFIYFAIKIEQIIDLLK